MNELQKRQEQFPDYYSFSRLQDDEDNVIISSNPIEPYSYYNDDLISTSLIAISSFIEQVEEHIISHNDSSIRRGNDSLEEQESTIIIPVNDLVENENTHNLVEYFRSTNVNITGADDDNKRNAINHHNEVLHFTTFNEDANNINDEQLVLPTTVETHHLITNFDDNYDNINNSRSEDNHVNKKFNIDCQLRFDDGVIERFNTARRNTVSVSKGISVTRVEERLPYAMLNIENYSWRDCVDVGLE
ncbi:8508_t:CDS:2 [Ambispora leptoticha]|uniref:8508_t:CDS:1 n=1 Tax=Ambispora leptoticha TaxID=144679 RepID=A0A9N8YSM0_9GLOM|nr:8508_t:CDS:2 [Ambispora leptoticha]